MSGRALVGALFGTIFLPVSTVAVLARVALIIAYRLALPRPRGYALDVSPDVDPGFQAS